MPGTFTISLDFELYWGVRDKIGLDSCRAALLGARAAIPRLLDLFTRYGVHATWATVGLLFFDDKDELLASLPARRPRYADPGLSPYDHVRHIGRNERADPCHYARSLIRRIREHPGQEIGTHTFSHYYCLEAGQSAVDFRADLEAAVAAGRRLGLTLGSLVFPRNQWSPSHTRVCAEVGIRALRGTERSWLYRPRAGGADGPAVRAGRLLDSYVNLSGHHGYRPSRCGERLTNIPASRFLRPFAPRLARLEPLRLGRIRRSMTAAAQDGCGYHLWWHPHNFGRHTDENLAILTAVLDHYRQLRDRYGMAARSMGELVPGEAGVNEATVKMPRARAPAPSAAGAPAQPGA